MSQDLGQSGRRREQARRRRHHRRGRSRAQRAGRIHASRHARAAIRFSARCSSRCRSTREELRLDFQHRHRSVFRRGAGKLRIQDARRHRRQGESRARDGVVRQRRARAPRIISASNCSARGPARSFFTCPIAATPRWSPHCWRAKCSLGSRRRRSMLENIKTGKLRALAVTTHERSPKLPDVPTVEQALGIAKYDVGTWFGMAGPAGMPPAVIARLNGAVRKASRSGGPGAPRRDRRRDCRDDAGADARPGRPGTRRPGRKPSATRRLRGNSGNLRPAKAGLSKAVPLNVPEEERTGTIRGTTI